MGTLWGIDLGGTKIEGVVLPDALSTEPICRMRVPTEAENGYDHVLGQIARLVDLMRSEVGSGPEAIGFGTPGVTDPKSGRLKNSNTQALNGMLLRDDLSDKLGVQAVLANDANCFALAEATYGAGKGAGTVFGVIMGTGVGGGIVIDGKIIGGAQGIAGEWGHNVLDPDGEYCSCGKRGCVETVLSGPALERFYRRRSGRSLRLPEIVELARAKEDESAIETLDRLISLVGQGLSVVVNILDPDVIVLGGGVGNVAELYSAGSESLARWVFNDSLQTKVVRPLLGDSAGVFGAAQLVAL